MPDIGGLRRRLDHAKQSAQAGLQQIQQSSMSNAPVGSEPRDAEEGATDDDVTEEVDRLRSYLASRRPPPGPVQGRWSIGIGDLLAGQPRVPAAAGRLIRNLDRYGGLAITDRTIEFDHDAIEWSSVSEIRTRNVIEYLLSDALIEQVGTLPLPWFPGRRKVLEALTKALLSLVAAAAREQLDKHADLRIPAEIEYRGAIRGGRQLSPGILAALVLADPAVNECLLATAQAHGVSVRPADGDALGIAGQRADSLRAKLGSLESMLGRMSPPVGESASVVSAHVVSADLQAAATRRRQPAVDVGEAGLTRGPEASSGLPDQGEVMIRLGHDVAGELGAAVVEREIAGVRGSDGALTFDGVRASSSFMKGPAHNLAALLNLESIAVGVWATSRLGMLQRRSATKQVERICQQDGLSEAIRWIYANVDHADKLPLDLLRESLGGLSHDMPGGEALLRKQIAKGLRKYR